MQMDMPHLGAAIDLDGVLIDGLPFHWEAFRICFAPYGFEPDKREVSLLEGIKTREIIDLMCSAHGLDLTEDQRTEAVIVKKAAYKEIFRPVPFDHAKDLLLLLYDIGCRLAIVTGTTQTSVRATLDALGVELDIDIISNELDIPGKPDPAPFATAATRMSLAARRVLAIENAPAGIQSARTAGLPCVAVASYLGPTDLRQAQQIFKNLFELTQWLREHHPMTSTEPWPVGIGKATPLSQ
jgi:beta-phosphoglucomutase